MQGKARKRLHLFKLDFSGGERARGRIRLSVGTVQKERLLDNELDCERTNARVSELEAGHIQSNL